MEEKNQSDQPKLTTEARIASKAWDAFGSLAAHLDPETLHHRAGDIQITKHKFRKPTLPNGATLRFQVCNTRNLSDPGDEAIRELWACIDLPKDGPLLLTERDLLLFDFDVDPEFAELDAPCTALVLKVTEDTFEITVEAKYPITHGSSGSGFGGHVLTPETNKILMAFESLLNGEEIASIREKLFQPSLSTVTLAGLCKNICLRVRQALS